MRGRRSTRPRSRRSFVPRRPQYIRRKGKAKASEVSACYVKVTFFRGTSLRPVPPGGKGKDARWIDIHEDDLDEKQLATWIKQAASIPGWDGGSER